MKLYQNGKYIATAYARRKLAPTVADYKQGNGENPAEFKIGLKEWEDYNKQAYQKMIEIGRQYALKPTGTDGFIDWQTMTKESFNEWESVEVDKQNGVAERNETVDKLLAKYN